MGKKKRLQERIVRQTKGIRESIAGIPTYEIPEEAQQLMEMYYGAAEGLEDVTGLAREATGIARGRTGVAEAPGTALARRDIQQSTAGDIQNILEAGGGSASALGAITQAGQAEQQAYGQLAAQTQQYRSQAELDLMNALRSEAGITADVTQAQAGLRGAGLQTMIGERGKAFESDLSKYLTGVQFETTQLAGAQQELQNLKNRRAQMISSMLGMGGKLGGALLGGPIGGILGGLTGGQGGGMQTAPGSVYENVPGLA